MTDCLIVGFNDTDFGEYVTMVEAMGTRSGAYRDLNLDFIEYKGRPYRSMDILNHFYFQDRTGDRQPFHYADFVWPVVMVLGSYLSKHGLSFDYVNLFHRDRDELREKLVHDDVLTVAITTTLYVAPQPILEILSFVRQYNETARIIIGGPFILNQAIALDQEALQELFDYLGADFYVISPEGEGALANIIRALKSNSGFDRVDNIAYRSGEGYVLTASSSEINPLEENPVDYGLFPRDQIGEFVSLRTSISCPFSCAFCGFPERAGKYRTTSVDCIEREMDAIRDLGTVSTLTFVDDTFNVPKKRFKDVLRMMIRNDYGFKWNCQYRCDHGDEETIDLMKEAGCEGVLLGVESGSDEMLERMNKTTRRKDYAAAIPRLREAGISTYASLIVGFPGETPASVRETLDLVEQTGPDFFRAHLWYCDPITPIARRRDEFGITGSAFEWSHGTMDAATACDLIEELYLSVENSTWLPQNGFEQWSTFYLQRKGMSLERIKTFLECFNAVAKEQLVYPGSKEIAPDLLDSLIESCRFDDPAQPDLRPARLRSGAAYASALEFWSVEFGDDALAPNLAQLSRQGGRDTGHATRPCTLAQSLRDELLAHRADVPAVFMAAYSVLLSRLSGGEVTPMIAAIEGEGVFPLKLQPSWDLSFCRFLLQTRLKTAQAAGRQVYAFHVVNDLLQKAKEAAHPVLDAGYVFCRKAGQEDGLTRALESRSAPGRAPALVLEVIQTGRDVAARFSYDEGLLDAQAVDKLGRHLAAILQAACETPGVLLGDIAPAGAGDEGSAAARAAARETFSF